MAQSSLRHMPVRVFWPSRLVFQAVIKNLGKHVGLDESLSPGIPLGQNFFLLELVQSFAFLNSSLHHGGRLF
jgi:hypothetical protein